MYFKAELWLLARRKRWKKTKSWPFLSPYLMVHSRHLFYDRSMAFALISPFDVPKPRTNLVQHCCMIPHAMQ